MPRHHCAGHTARGQIPELPLDDLLENYFETLNFLNCPSNSKARKERPKPEELKEITVEQLSQNENWIACLGYVFEPVRIFFDSHRGKDGIFVELKSDRRN